MIKKLTDEERQAKVTDLVLEGLSDRDDIDFSFEDDFKRMSKKISINKILDKDAKYRKRFVNSVMKMYLNNYLGDTIKAGNKQAARFKESFISE